MPLLNNGIVPGGQIGAELQAVTRRAFIPKMVVQIYQATPLMSLLLRNGQRAKGGVSQITVPVQGSSFVSFSWSDYSGVFPQPSVQTAAQNAEFNLKLGVVPIPFMGMEAIIQSSEVVIPLLEARMVDAKTVWVQTVSTSLFANNSAAPGGQIINGLPEAYDDGTNVTTYGGISRTTNPFWKAYLKTSAGGILTRIAFIKEMVHVTSNAGGEAPDFCVMSFQDWTTLMTDFMSGEQFNTSPGSRYGKDDVINAGFRGLMLGDTPVFADPFCPVGTSYLINSKYLAMYISEDADFAFSGFYSAIPNLQIANVGVLITALNCVCTKPSSGGRITGITGGAW